MRTLKTDVQEAAGCLQTCTGIRSGIEASVHATREAWKKESTECLLQVDAENAFNKLNRGVALHNIRQLCPSMHTYLFNHYQQPAQLTLTDDNCHEILYSEEGCTQGDPSAMNFYAVGTKPLTNTLAEAVKKEDCMQAWYADDSSAAGKLAEVRVWWDTLQQHGPKYGYFPTFLKRAPGRVYQRYFHSLCFRKKCV